MHRLLANKGGGGVVQAPQISRMKSAAPSVGWLDPLNRSFHCVHPWLCFCCQTGDPGIGLDSVGHGFCWCISYHQAVFPSSEHLRETRRKKTVDL